MTPTEAGRFALALTVDAFWVRSDSDRVATSAFGSLAAAQGESSRVRAVLDGSCTFHLASGATLASKLKFGVRHDADEIEPGVMLRSAVRW